MPISHLNDILGTKHVLQDLTILNKVAQNLTIMTTYCPSTWKYFNLKLWHKWQLVMRISLMLGLWYFNIVRLTIFTLELHIMTSKLCYIKKKSPEMCPTRVKLCTFHSYWIHSLFVCFLLQLCVSPEQYKLWFSLKANLLLKQVKLNDTSNK